MSFRVGLGYDIHRLVEGRPLMLGGLHIPFAKGLLGHSDGDAVLHAVADAYLGAAGLPDIGELFSDKDPANKGADSRVLLRKVVEKVAAGGWTLENLDLNVIAEEPRMKPHKEALRQSIAGLLGVDPGRVNLKAKTREGLDAVGNREAIEVHCVVLLRSPEA